MPVKSRTGGATGRCIIRVIALSSDRPSPELVSPELIELRQRIRELESEVARLRTRRLSQEEAQSGLAEALTERLAAYEEVERLAKVGSWFWDLRTNEVKWSAELYRILGYPADQAASVELFFAALHPEDRERVRARSQVTSSTGLTEPGVSCRVLQPDGSLRHIKLIGSAILDAEGQLVRLVGAVLDVTAFVLNEEELRRQARLLDEAHRVAGISSWIWRREQGRFEWSETSTPLIGVESGAGDSSELPKFVHPEDLAAWEAARAQIARGVAPPPLTFRIVRPDGATRYMTMDAKLDESGTVLGTLQDVTGRWELEQRLRHSQKMEAVGTLAGGIAHDFNNYLVVIQGNLDLLRSSEQSASSSQSFDEMARAAERCASLTRQLLAFARRHPDAAQLVDFEQIIAGSAGMLKRLLGPGIELIWSTESTDLRVLADPSQIELVIVNLAVNARDAMPSGGKLFIDVAPKHLSNREPNGEIGAGEYVVLRVADTGTGIPEGVRERLFEPYFTTKPPGHGTGLGLATVYGIVKQSRGHIRIESRLGHGSTFTLYFPARRGVQGSPHVPKPSTTLAQGETILVVEDEPSVRRLTRRLLERGGYKVLEAADGLQALELASRSQPLDLVLTDINMPRMDGIALSRRLRAADPHVKLLMMTGNPSFSLQELTRDLEDCPILSKPFDLERLLGAVRAALGQGAR
ncbi:MAG TPA: response regulator [Polyangiaceae bacterium]|nr:response regulator [Polyangiaceae bacterium]